MSEAEVLAKILERLEKIEAQVAEMHGGYSAIAARGPAIGEAAGASAQFAWDQAVENGIDPVKTAETLVPLALDAARPESLALLKRLSDRRGDLAFALDQADIVQSEMKAAGIDPAATTARGARILARLSKPEMLDFAEKIFDRVDQARQAMDGADVLVREGALDPKTFDVLGLATRALVEVRREGAESVGFFGALKALGDPDVQRATGFGLKVAKRLGQLLGR
jgi:hypothetical protein